MNTPHPAIIIVVLNWNNPADTIECLQSLSKLTYSNHKTILVDNGSTDDSVARIKEAYPEMIIVENKENLGFSEGNNVGIRYALKAGAEYVLLLNNDTLVDPDLLNELLSAHQQFPKAGILGAKIYFADPPDLIWYAGAKWSCEEGVFRHLHIGEKDSDLPSNESTCPIDYACGCAMLIRREVFAKIGLLESKFFLYYEDSDFCYKARRAGFGVIYVPKAKVWHKISASTGGNNYSAETESNRYTYYTTRNRLLWMERNLSLFNRLKTPFYGWFSSEMRRDMKIINSTTSDQYLLPAKRRVKYRLIGLRDYLLRRFGYRSI